MIRPIRLIPLLAFAFAFACAEPTTSPDHAGVSAPAFVISTTGTWDLYPPQASTYSTAVQQPVNFDGSSNFKSNGNAVIPVKFALSSGTGPAILESIIETPNTNTDNDYSFLSFTPGGTLTFGDLTMLQAGYGFTLGNCHGGALRWSLRTSATQSVFIYYGDLPNFTDCSTTSQSGTNMIGLTDARFDLTQYGGPFYGTYTDALALVGASTPLVRVSLVLDGGWAGDQRLTLSSATVNDNTFTPAPASASSPTCDLPEATIEITKTDGSPTGPVNDPVSIQPADDNGIFRVVDCKYMYNLATSSLSGPGTYHVYAVIGGNQASGPAIFDLR